MWLREIIGFALTKLSEDDTIQGMLKVLLSKDVIDLQFNWQRYASLKQQDFQDDLSIIAAQDLMGQGP